MGTNLGGLAASNPNTLRPGAGKLFLVPYPKTASEVKSVTIGGGGTGYVQGGVATFSGGGATRQAQGFANVTAGAITGIVITDPGAGYTSAPTVTVATGSGATLTPVLGNGIGPLRCLAPSASPAYADYQEGFMQRFYSDPADAQTLNPLLSAWAYLTADGFKPKFKQNLIEVDPADGPKFALAAQDTMLEAEFSFMDVDVDHLIDAFSSVGANLTTIAASTGKAGRKRLGIGAERALTIYTAMYRMPSVLYPGEFDHLIIPRCTIGADFDLELSKGKVVTGKVKLTAQAEPSLVSPFNGELMTHLWDFASAAAV